MASELVFQLCKHARRRPDATAVMQFEPGGGNLINTLTWGECLAASSALAHRLREQTPADAVVMLGLCNRLEFHIAFLATLLADRAVFPFIPEGTPAEVSSVVERAKVAAVIGEPGFIDQPLFGDRLRIDRRTLRDLSGAQPGSDAAIAQHAGRGALLMLSSGTTGLPRIVRRSAASLDAVARNCANLVGLQPTDRVLLPVLLYHSYGLEHGLLGPTYAGCAVELHAVFDGMRLRDRLLDRAVTVFPGVPFVFEALAQVFAKREMERDAQCVTVRRAYSAGGMLPASVIETCRERMGIEIGQVYGATEIGSVTFNDPEDEDFIPTAVGRAMPGVDIRIVDRIDPTLGDDVPAGVEGHIVVRATSMFDGYVDAEDPHVRDGYFLTGDLGLLDAKHRLRITGRSKLLIDIDGRKVSPLEVEAVLCQHPDVREAAVIPLRVTETANRLKALIVPQRGATPDEMSLRRFTRERLSAHKVPRIFELRPDLPRTQTGEIDREALQ